MEKPWLNNYPKGVNEYIDIDKYSSVIDIYQNSIKLYKDRPAFSNFGTTISYADFDKATRSVAAYLQHSLKLKKGERVAIMMPNLLQNPVAIFGVLMAGLTVVNTNPLYTTRELRYQIKDSGATAIIVMENFAHTVANILDDTDIKHVIITKMGDMLNFPKSKIINFMVKYVKKLIPHYHIPHAIPFKKILSTKSLNSVNDESISQDDIAFLQYTGGTTGTVKGAVLTHQNMVANMMQASEWVKNTIEAGKETIITALPLYHIFSLTANCLVFMEAGAKNILITNPRDFKGFINEMKKNHFTAITGVNTLFNALISTPGFDQIDFSSLKISLGGGMAVQPYVAGQWKAITGCPLIEAYGLTETSPAVCINPIDIKEYNGSIGLPISSTYCKLIDENGRTLGHGETGELCVKGPQVMQGYWGKPEETELVLSDDGWLKTGDIATMDKGGFFYILDRIKDMVLVSGFNVYPSEIENVVADHPSVQECGVIGVPDQRQGEAIKLFVVTKNPALNAEQLLIYCRENLTNYKIPSKIIFIDKIPKTSVGKVSRRELRNL